MAKTKKITLVKKHTRRVVLSSFWFIVGFVISGAILISLIITAYEIIYRNSAIPGVFVGNVYVGGKTAPEIQKIFHDKNNVIRKNTIIFSSETGEATVSGQFLNAGYDTNLITDQALSLGKTSNMFSNIYVSINSYLNGIYLKAPYEYNVAAFQKTLDPLQQQIYKEPTDAQFTVENSRVVAFKESRDGRTIDYDLLKNMLDKEIESSLYEKNPRIVTIQIPIKTLKPKITTEKANSFGIAEVIGEGSSMFQHSIANRVYNISLAASRVNGILVAPGQVFSFDQYLGDVTKYTGYKEAYVIKDGKTILGDGGGVCQVSTTLFRAILNAGLPVVERVAHAYRVGYYEQDSPPGLDATVYYPSVDLKFENDTGNYILVQSTFNPDNLTLKYTLYGKKDGRTVSMTKPVILDQTPPPPPLYQDDPNLPAGVVNQIDFEAWGARVDFKRTVTKNGKVIISDDFFSNYRPWQAVFVRGTKS